MRLELEEWESEFIPVPNHFDDNASYNGFMFETYEPEYSFVKNSDKFQWTLIEVDGTQYIIPGLHIVNRLGYFLTEKEYEGEHKLIVDTDDMFPISESIEATYKYIRHVEIHGKSDEDVYEDIVKFYNEHII